MSVALARTYLTFFGTLLLVALVPLASSWESYIVKSSSMEPTLHVGDVVVAAPLQQTAEVPLGRVMVFDDPARVAPDAVPRTLIHRVINRNDDGSFISAGDANRQWDTTPLPRHMILAQARLRVPWVALPVDWYSKRQFTPLVVVSAVTALALWLVATDLSRRRRRRGGGGGIETAPCENNCDTLPEGSGTDTSVATARRARRVGRTTVLASATLAIVTVGTASAGFSALTMSPGNNWSVSARTMLPYKTNVLADSPWGFYETEEASGGSATDSSGNNRTGSYGGTVTYRRPGALTRVPGYSVLLGSNARLVAGTTTTSNPTTFSIEVWFKTTTNSGGKLIGFESTRNQSSGTYDRHVFMRNDGKLSYGGWTNSGTSMITTTAAYNDGLWHHFILTARPISGSSMQSSNLYVDGVRVATGNTTAVRNYAGYWRAGAGNLPSVSGTPSSVTFEGSIDNFAVYTTVLSAVRVEIHYASR